MLFLDALSHLKLSILSLEKKKDKVTNLFPIVIWNTLFALSINQICLKI